LFPALFAFYKGYTVVGLIQLTIFFSSLNYWKDPKIDSWQRKLDIVCVVFGVSYQILCSFGAEYQGVYSLFIALGVLSYFYSKKLLEKKKWWPSVYFHSLMHVLINTGIVILYSGALPLGH
jgi:hypothetical protein